MTDNRKFMFRIDRALLSVTDKTGIVEFARALHQIGVELVSTGGTARALHDGGVRVREVSEITEFPEMLDGRVKTIHPRIAGGMLAQRNKPEHMDALARHNIPTIDLVVVNLYAFEKTAAQPGVTFEELIENIDIGGPTMIRAAAKNWEHVAVVTSPADYEAIAHELRAGRNSLSHATRWNLARKAFALTAAYDRAITHTLAGLDHQGGRTAAIEETPARLDLLVPRSATLRYGENPHQAAALYHSGTSGVAGAKQLQGKDLSYNNLVDVDAAWQLIGEFQALPASAIIKHTNPCGCAEAETLAESYRRAFGADPVSAFGGVLAFNREVEEETAFEIAKTFIEVIAAPAYSSAALHALGAKKNLRLLQVHSTDRSAPTLRSITGGYLMQSADTGKLDRSTARVVTQRAPTEEEWNALAFGWKLVKHVKSNAIVYARPGQLISAGAGQMSRVDSVKVGAGKAHLPLAGSVLASDAFFPFPDGLETAATFGITAAIQPGGSVKDAEEIAAADRLGLAMVFTGMRHFRH